jgi:predicted PurR-regulated permease PerM
MDPPYPASKSVITDSGLKEQPLSVSFKSSARVPTPFISQVLIVALIAGLSLVAIALHKVLLVILGAVVLGVLIFDSARLVRRVVKLRHGQALTVALLISLALLIAITWIFGAQISAQFKELAQKLPVALSGLQERVSQDPMGQQLVAIVTKQVEQGGASFAGLAAQAGGWAFNVFDVLFQSLVVISAAIFLAGDPRGYRGGILRLLPKPQRRRVQSVLDQSGKAISGWLRGTLISMSITACLVLVCLLAFGVPAPIALALLAGFSQIVPLIGPIVSTLVGVTVAATISFEVAGWVGLSYIVISQLEANLITPKILKDAVNVAPALSLFSILALGTLFGLLGVVLAIPLVLVFCIAIEVFRRPAKPFQSNQATI